MTDRELLRKLPDTRSLAAIRNEFIRRAVAMNLSVEEYLLGKEDRPPCHGTVSSTVPARHGRGISREVLAGGMLDVRPELRRMVRDDVFICEQAKVILEADWDGIDPSGLMDKAPAEVFAFLEEMADGVPKKASQMHAKARGLFETIRDSYFRAAAARTR